MLLLNAAPRPNRGNNVKLIDQLTQAWNGDACGVTIDIVGNEESNAELQWVLAIPITSDTAPEVLARVGALRDQLSLDGFLPVDSTSEASLRLPNSQAVEAECPYRPTECLGEHVVASGRGRFPEMH